MWCTCAEFMSFELILAFLCLAEARFKDFVDYYCLVVARFYLFISFLLCSRVSQLGIYIFGSWHWLGSCNLLGSAILIWFLTVGVVSLKLEGPKTWGMIWLPCKVEGDEGGSLEDDGEYGEDVVLTSYMYLVLTEARVGIHWLCGAQLYVLMSLPGSCS